MIGGLVVLSLSGRAGQSLQPGDPISAEEATRVIDAVGVQLGVRLHCRDRVASCRAVTLLVPKAVQPRVTMCVG